MQLHEEEGLAWLSFELLDEAGVTNGVILKPYNMAREKAPNQEEVIANFKKVEERFSLSKLQFARQVHGSDVAFVRKESDVPTSDALITDEKSLGLLMMHADCQIACFYDPLNKVIAAAHAGWRGNVKRIYSKTISAMKEQYGTDPKNLLVAISPSLGPTWSEFVGFAKEWPEPFWIYKKEPCHFDLWQMAEDELLENGLLPHHIEIARLCTYDDGRFYSYRRAVHGGHTGPVIATNGTFLAL